MKLIIIKLIRIYLSGNHRDKVNFMCLEMVKNMTLYHFIDQTDNNGSAQSQMTDINCTDK